jgi:RHS repeat-associated protein
VISSDSSNPSEYFPCFDANGNITEYVDETGTNVVAHYEYDPFGNIIRQTGPAADDNPFRFSTHYHDDETGLINFGYRYYSPELGRFISRDPIEEEGGLNLFAYVANDPQNETDYLGLLASGERAIVDCRSGSCSLKEGAVPAQAGLPWFTEMAFLTHVSKSLVFTHENYIESGFPVYGKGKYGGIVYYESALKKVNEAKKRLAPKLAAAEEAYQARLRKIDTLGYSEREKERQRGLARKKYLADVRRLKGTLVGSGGARGRQTPLSLFLFPEMISNYHTHTISGPPSASDRSVLRAIQTKLGTDDPIWGVYSWVDRKSPEDCRKAELAIYSSGSPSVGGGSVRGMATGVFILY